MSHAESSGDLNPTLSYSKMCLGAPFVAHAGAMACFSDRTHALRSLVSLPIKGVYTGYRNTHATMTCLGNATGTRAPVSVIRYRVASASHRYRFFALTPLIIKRIWLPDLKDFVNANGMFYIFVAQF